MPLEDQQEQKLDTSSENTAKAGDNAVKEANAGKAELSNSQKMRTDYLKAGGTSGITEDFGKPMILESENPEAYRQVSGDSLQKVASEDPESYKQVTPDTAEDGTMGKVGDRSKDSGVGKPDKPEVTLDDQGRMTEYKRPDGQRYEIHYGDDGKPDQVTVHFEGSQSSSFKKNAKGEFVNTEDSSKKLNECSVDDKGNVTLKTPQGIEVIGKDGSYQQKDFYGQQAVREQIDADGTTHVYTDRTETVTKPGSHISEIKSKGDGTTVGYEMKDDQGHVKKIDKNEDGTVLVTEGDKSKVYTGVTDDNGNLVLTDKDKNTVEMKTDGTEIHRDKGGHVTEITNSDGETTKFKRVGDKATEVTVTDGQGHVVEKRNKGIEVNDKDGSYKVEVDKDHKIERAADGTEKHVDKDGNKIETDQDKLMDKFKNYTPEQQRQLRQDLADIDKLPEEQRKKVYESLERIARNDEHPDQPVRLTGQQARELVASTAHNIAHPESIQQGDKMSCVAANTEATMARNHPEVYADMVSRLATEGKYTTKDGTTIEAQRSPDGSLAPKSDAYGQRSYASELFQNGVNQMGMKDGDTYKSYPPGSPELEPRPAGVTPSRDIGERVVHKDGSVDKFTGLTAEKQAEVMNKLVPEDKYKATNPIETPADLEKAVKDNGGTPLNVGIHLGPESGFSGVSGESGAASGGDHAVNITKIETGPDGKKYVYYENPAGGSDHSYPHGTGVPIDDFVKGMKASKMKAVVKEKH